MKHLDVVDGELAAVPVEERPVAGTIGQNLDLVILKLRSPDAEVWTAMYGQRQQRLGLVVLNIKSTSCFPMA